VKVIGGGRVLETNSSGYTEHKHTITGSVKGSLIDHLHEKKLYVWSFGDSPLDLEMLTKANQAVVVVGEQKTRSKTMDKSLSVAIANGLSARQIILPKTESPRLDIEQLPQISLTDSQFLESLFCRRIHESDNVFHATNKNAAKVLMTSTRDARFAGPSLRKAHKQVGRYLALEYLTDLIGVEEYEIPHVQGNITTGHRLKDEMQTTIVPLMRGGEPMAFGVSQAFPLASFRHARVAADVRELDLKGKRTVILVDSVVNTGKSVVEFVDHIRLLEPSVRMIIVSGVVQDKVLVQGRCADLLSRDQNLSLVALRVSKNKYTGRGGTDTGHRLFNTTDQD